MSYDLPHEVEIVVLQLLEDLDTARSLSIAICLRYSELGELVSFETDPRKYLDAEAYWRDCQATSILRKCRDIEIGVDKAVDSIKTFYTCEAQCFLANRRLYPLIERILNPYDNEGALPILREMRKKIQRWLGPCPDLPQGRFGPGATFVDRGCRTTVPHKLSSVPALTPSAWSFLIPWGGTYWASACASEGRDPVFVKGNRFASVPKDAKRNRCIAVEPSINLFYQLAYGRVIRSRLRNLGLDLDVAQENHRLLALASSSAGHLATLDLSNASDTVSRSLVELLLPKKWFDVLFDLRSSKTLIEGRWVFLEKFSSMGNGFTFELETLIFLAIIDTLCPGSKIGKDLSAFGDDLIFPTERSKDVMSALSFLGLTVNVTKSFVDGPFRESCGGDFFNGVAVRPFFLKEFPREPHQLIAFANGIARATNNSIGRRHLVHRAWVRLLGFIPVDVRRCRGPQSLGDLVIHDERDRWVTKTRSSIRYFRCWLPSKYRKVRWRQFSPEVTLAAALYGCPDGRPNGRLSASLDHESLGITPRSGVMGYRTGWVPLS
jgi:hypothetical protein